MQRCSIDVQPSRRPPSPSAAAAATAKQPATARSSPTAYTTSAARLPQLQRPANLLLNAAVTAAFIAYTCSSRQRFVSALLHLGSLGLMWRAMELLMFAASVPARDWLGAWRGGAALPAAACCCVAVPALCSCLQKQQGWYTCCVAYH
jgi:hypothetical protein